MKKALITGVTGQDGSYLAEFLLKKGYEVHGIIRRTSTFNTSRIIHLYHDTHEKDVRFFLHYGDLADSSVLNQIIKKIKPDEIYNLGAQSHVRVSFDIPEYTADITGLGTLRLLDAIRESGVRTKLYQASSSEMFGNTKEIPQKETTPFVPCSPYAISKVFAYWTTLSYRQSYNIFVCNGILFNHESVPKNSPVIIKINNFIDILPIEDLFKSEKHRYEGILTKYKGCNIWNGEGWAKIIDGNCYQNKKKSLKLIQTRGSSYEATYDHIAFDKEGDEVETKNFKVGDKVFQVKFPEDIRKLSIDKNLAKFIGYVVGDGSIDNRGRIRLTGTNKEELLKIVELIVNQFGWGYRINTFGPGKYNTSKKDVWQLDINNDTNFGLWLRRNIYTLHNEEKKVPYFILNSGIETKKQFFGGYYLADGRNKGNERYKYKGFTAKSATLCLGMVMLFRALSNQTVKCKCEYKEGSRYYYVQFGTTNPSNKGKHLRKELNEIIKITDTESEDGWLFDVQTDTQTFATGPNLFKIHNSPRRGETFVSRKITRAAARIKLGLQDKLFLGNLESKRDWGYAPEYVEAMWLMLQQEKPDDFILATNEMHSVKEFLEEAFGCIELDWKEYVKIDPYYFRPAEVEQLQGDYSKAKRILGWKPKTKFKELVRVMVNSDMELAKNEKYLKEKN